MRRMRRCAFGDLKPAVFTNLNFPVIERSSKTTKDVAPTSSLSHSLQMGLLRSSPPQDLPNNNITTSMMS